MSDHETHDGKHTPMPRDCDLCVLTARAVTAERERDALRIELAKMRQRLEVAQLALAGVRASRLDWVSTATKTEMKLTQLRIASRRVLELRNGCGVHEDGSCVEEAFDALRSELERQR